MPWQDLEQQVRTIAVHKWDVPASPETVNGVRIDCLLRVKPDYYVLVEVSEEKTLAKLRIDLAKFASVRPFLFSKNIYAECFFVCASKPPASLIETGRGENVTVLDPDQFAALFFDFKTYRYTRLRSPFGSSINPLTGKADSRRYVPVGYLGLSPAGRIGLAELARFLREGRKIILLGNYGTGKSRCIRELFTAMAADGHAAGFYPLAIDLRENWGTRRGHEVLRRHFDGLGLSESASAVNKILGKGAICLLLDGFDEIGSQAWSDDAAKLSKIRADSLLGVKDLLAKTQGGALVAGRGHYFNSNTEMLSCLGLDEHTTILVKCADEFTDEEMRQYLGEIGVSTALASWIPRRPLLCQILAEMEPESLDSLSGTSSWRGEVRSWDSIMEALCKREAKIHPALDAFTIRRVLRRLARVSRVKSGDVGPISISEINSAFEEVTGLPPVDESAAMLQRLPTLGRLASESSDRQFVDEYFLDGLRAEDVIELVEYAQHDPWSIKWKNPLRRFGLTLLAEELFTGSSVAAFMSVMKEAARRRNSVLAGDILAALLLVGSTPVDFGNLSIIDGHVSYLDLSTRSVSNLAIHQSVINEVDISDCQVDNVTVSECVIQQVRGVSASKGLPNWIRSNAVERFEAVDTVARIRQASLSTDQRVFVTIVKKLFFQPGAGRREEALLRGLGSSANKKSADRIVKRLMGYGIIDKFKGDEGWVYFPDRSFTHRMDRIITELTLSQDPLWLELPSD